MPITTRLPVLALLLLLASPRAAPAATVGTTIDQDLSRGDLVALAEAPPALLPLCRDVVTLATARRQGLLAGREADRQLAFLLDALADRHAALELLSREAFVAALVLETRTAIAVARDLIATEGDGLHPDLARAVERLVLTLGDAILVVHRGAEGPDSRCFSDFALCASFCSTRDHWLIRAACMADCELDLVQCLGETAQRTNPFRKPPTDLTLP